MPKRTNAFQQLIKRIYEQLLRESGTLEESAMVRERGSAAEREVDVLLTHAVFGTTLRIGVECRGRGKKDDIEWIDGLIGKYRDLDVHKVIAVSRAGFSRNAREKAAANRIDTLTLEEAMEVNWPAQFTRLGIGRWARRDTPCAIALKTNPDYPLRLTLEQPLYTAEGLLIASLAEVGRRVYEANVAMLNQTIDAQFLTLFKTLEDMNTKSIRSDIQATPAFATYLHGPSGERFSVERIIVRTTSSFKAEPVNVTHYILGQTQATIATIETEPGRDCFSVMAVQAYDRPNQVSVNVQVVQNPAPVKKKANAKKKEKRRR